MSSSRSIASINVPIKSDISGFSKGIKSATTMGQRFSESFGKEKNLGKLTGGIKEVGSGLGSCVQGVAKLNVGLAGLGAVRLNNLLSIGGLVETLGKFAVSGFTGIGDLVKDAADLGIEADALSRLRSVAAATRTDVKDLGTFIRDLNQNINDSIGHTTNASQAFAMLGTSAEELKRLTPEDQIKKLNQGFDRLTNDADKARAAFLLTGESGVKVFRLLRMSSEEFRKTFDNADPIKKEEVDRFNKMQESLDKLGKTLTDVVQRFSTQFAPAIEGAANKIAELLDYVLPRLRDAQAIIGYITGSSVTPSAVSAPKGNGLPSSAATKPKGMAGPTAIPTAPSNPAKAVETQATAVADLTDKLNAAAKAQARVNDLAKIAEKQADQLAKTKPKYLDYHYDRRVASQQKMVDRNKATEIELDQARKDAERLRKESLSPSQAAAEALRKGDLDRRVNELKDEQRQSIQTSGMDEIHRRVAGIKGISTADRKALIEGGYRAREADKTSALRDSIEESTKNPLERLTEDANRIDRLVKLGTGRGGISLRQGILAKANLAKDAGLGGPTPFAGAIDARTQEGRSYLLSQTLGREQDPITLARQANALQAAGNGFLAGIRQDLAAQANRNTKVVSM